METELKQKKNIISGDFRNSTKMLD